ncbi:MAG TPA: polyprenyl synthetase family protein, partial [Thermodesulfobacteriota bacterium]|nr:polyprenyl synthetase family protein [Thermodesulfobacteriota bacterium]
PAAWTLEGARRAVLIGDVVFAGAIKMMADLGREDGAAAALAIAQVSSGALNEPLDPLDLDAGKLKRGLYEKIIRLKTGVLFGTACHVGALAAKMDGDVGGKYFRYGVKVGEAYQIADDLQDLRACVARGALRSGDAAALAPAVVYFAEELRATLISSIRDKEPGLGPVVLGSLGELARRMNDEIVSRLDSALSEIAGAVPENEFARILRDAPRELIRMFNEG